jgi:hypothetical protein
VKVVEQVLKLSKEIFALEHQEKRLRAEREAKKLQLAKLLREQDGDAPSAGEEEAPVGSVPSQVLALFQSRLGQPLTVDQIEQQLPSCDRNSIRTALSRLKAARQIENPDRGTYVMPNTGANEPDVQEGVSE